MRSRFTWACSFFFLFFTGADLQASSGQTHHGAALVSSLIGSLGYKISFSGESAKALFQGLSIANDYDSFSEKLFSIKYQRPFNLELKRSLHLACGKETLNKNDDEPPENYFSCSFNVSPIITPILYSESMLSDQSLHHGDSQLFVNPNKTFQITITGPVAHFLYINMQAKSDQNLVRTRYLSCFKQSSPQNDFYSCQFNVSSKGFFEIQNKNSIR